MKFLTLENGWLGALLDDTVVDVVAAGRALSVQPGVDTLDALVPAGDEAAPSHGKPIVLYANNSKGADAYIELAREIIARGKKNSETSTLENSETNP